VAYGGHVGVGSALKVEGAFMKINKLRTAYLWMGVYQEQAIDLRSV